jgi:hypothetical protein
MTHKCPLWRAIFMYLKTRHPEGWGYTDKARLRGLLY